MPDFSDHDVWRLLLTVGGKGLDATFYNTKSRQCVPTMHRSWECPEPDVLKNIEDAIYEDPLLTDDYNTTILVRPHATLLVPAELVDMEDEDSLRQAIDVVDTTEHKDVWCEPLGEAVAIYSTAYGIRDFLGRTFLTEDVHHLLKPFVEHFADKAKAESGEKMWVHLGDETVDMVAFRNGAMVHAGSWYCRPGADAAYYIMFAWHTLGFDVSQGELRVSGRQEYRREVLPLLRRHVNYVSMTVSASSIAEAVAQGVSMSVALKTLPLR